jgi:hypothetical protein
MALALDSSDGSSRRRLVRLLRTRPSMACVVAATVPALGESTARMGLMPFPDRCQWGSVDEVDWSSSLVRPYPLLSGTYWGGWYPPDQMLGVRVRRSEVLGVVQEQSDAVKLGWLPTVLLIVAVIAVAAYIAFDFR